MDKQYEFLPSKKELEDRYLERDLSIIGNVNRLNILCLLYKNKELSFDKIAKKISRDKNKLTLDISLLEECNFVFNNEKSYPKRKYGLTEKGRDVINYLKTVISTMAGSSNKIEDGLEEILLKFKEKSKSNL